MNSPDDIQKLLITATHGVMSPDDAALLLEACKADPKFLEQLASLVAMERLLTLAHQDPDGVMMSKECERRVRDALVPDQEAAWCDAWQVSLQAQRLVQHRRIRKVMLASAAAVVMGLTGWLFIPRLGSHTEFSRVPQILSLAGAEFAFADPLLSRPNAPLPMRQEIVLKRGLAQIRFPNGATTIVRGPAVFECADLEHLRVKLGHYSVHAPAGAEGFTLATPMVNVVDRGTRFGIDVDESGHTEVQVIEGKVDLRTGETADSKRLTQGEAVKMTRPVISAARTIPYAARRYQRQMPDRITAWKASLTSDGLVQNLQSVSVQRAGEVIEYPFDRLIPADITAFKTNSTGSRVHIALESDSVTPDQKVHLLSDASLATGIINPGGSAQPPARAPVIGQGADDTPGMAVHFQRPVINAPGPDIVLFELQNVSNPPQGDAFHICPLDFTGGKHALTIRRYDFDFNSPQSLKLRPFYTVVLPDPIASLEDLLSTPGEFQPLYLDFRILAVSIDLSALGFSQGESVEDLFIQDAPAADSKLDEVENIVDPVFIGGFPAP